jgi:Na+-translocating ferredoxin:NAD+ oxidoreductase RNF subunit RnfB
MDRNVSNGVKVFQAACKGCVNCIKSCPTEAIRVINGNIRMIPELCIDCGECLRVCNKKALGLEEDDWDVILAHPPVVAAADPTFFSQFGAYWRPALLREALLSQGVDLLWDEMSFAYDQAALAVAKIIERSPREHRPLISTYCPAVIRLIQVRFQELLGRLVPVQNPLDAAVDRFRARVGREVPVTLFAPCPAKITMARDPVCRSDSPIDHVVSVRRVTRSLLASGPQVPSEIPELEGRRWLKWALRGGESRHVRAMAEKPLVTLAVSGMRNALDVLQEVELGRLKGVDFLEVRVCDLGCIGGIATAESRFLSSLRLQSVPSEWDVTPERRAQLEEAYPRNEWAFERPILPRPRIPLSDNLSEAMAKLKEMKAIHAELPHIDCGSCGRPSCRAMAEDIVRGEGEVTDCIFKLRESIADMAGRIHDLARHVPHTLKGRS